MLPAAQLYTLREFLKTPADIASTLKRVKSIGYDHVQVSGLGPIDPRELRRILDAEGLTCCVTHTSLDRLRSEPEKLADEHRTLGCSLTAIGGFNPGPDAPADAWLAFAREYGQLADKLASLGIRLGYHNHAHEFLKPPGGHKTAQQILLDECPPSVWFEIDTYWVQDGGADPAECIERCFARIPVVHLKDMQIGKSPEGRHAKRMAEVGEGNLPWKRILHACRTAGVRYLAVEQDTCYRDPFDSLATSLTNLRAMGV